MKGKMNGGLCIRVHHSIVTLRSNAQGSTNIFSSAAIQSILDSPEISPKRLSERVLLKIENIARQHLTGPLPSCYRQPSSAQLQSISSSLKRLESAFSTLQCTDHHIEGTSLPITSTTSHYMAYLPPPIPSQWLQEVREWVQSFLRDGKRGSSRGRRKSPTAVRLIPDLLDVFICVFDRKPTSTVDGASHRFLAAFFEQLHNAMSTADIQASAVEKRELLQLCFVPTSEVLKNEIRRYQKRNRGTRPINQTIQIELR